eukprot:309096_1
MIMFSILVIILIAINNAVQMHHFNQANPMSSTLDLSNVADDCYVECLGADACYNWVTITGPIGYVLTIDVDSTTYTTTTFKGSVMCQYCSSLNINVKGLGRFHSGGIFGPLNGLATIDCTGPSQTQGYVCHTTWLFARHGFGTQSGQIYVKDVSAITGRINIYTVIINCVDANGQTNPQNTARCGGGWMWATQWGHHGYLECTGPLTCQPTTPSKIEPHPGIYTVAGGGLGDPLARGEGLRLLGSDDSIGDGFIIVWKMDYYMMRVCEVIIVIEIFVFLIVVSSRIMRNCNKKTYSKVKYNGDVTDEEN